MESQKLTAKFTSPREVLLVSPAGDRCQRFEAGETALVHRSLFGVAIASGLMPEEPLEITLEAENTSPTPKKSQEQIVHEGLIEACRLLILRGNPNDFTLAQGLPRASSVKKLVNFNFTAQDVKRAFEEAMHEVNTNGDDGKEHSEPGSGAAE